MRGYWRRKADGGDGAITRGTSFRSGKGPDPEHRDDWEEVQVVPVDAVVVELPELIETGWGWASADKLRSWTFQDGDNLDRIEQSALANLAAVRAERRAREATGLAREATERDTWRNVSREEARRQAEYQKQRADRLDDALETVKARYAAREDALREASNALFTMESTITELRQRLEEARS